MSRERAVALDFEGTTLEGVMVSRRDGARRPAVILFPTVMGVSELELGFARDLVHLGYSAFVADVFGKHLRGAARPQMGEAMKALRADRARLRRMLAAILDQVRGLDEVEGDAIAVAGYCFGGLCALDLARTGAELRGVATFHGILEPPGLPAAPIAAKVIAFHGWDDPMVPPAAIVRFGQEMTEAGADWQLHAFGNAVHGFTNPGATGAIPGVLHNPVAAERAWTGFVNFLEEVLSDNGG